MQFFENYTLEENFKGGKHHGYLIERMKAPFIHHPDHESRVHLVEQYQEGQKEGLSERFYEGGARVRESWKNDQLQGKSERWFGNGQKELERNYSNGKLEGAQYEWYENGQLKLQENHKNGVQIGESLKYLENGKLKRKKHYKNGKIEGVVYELWDFKGRLIDGGVYSETTYSDGKPNGMEKVFYPNGQKMREGILENGIEKGERIWYNTNGTISLKEYYKDGELDGERSLYDEQGILESVQHYRNGERMA